MNLNHLPISSLSLYTDHFRSSNTLQLSYSSLAGRDITALLLP